MKKVAAKLFAKFIVWKNKKWIENPISAQEKTLKDLIKKIDFCELGRGSQIQNAAKILICFTNCTRKIQVLSGKR